MPYQKIPEAEMNQKKNRLPLNGYLRLGYFAKVVNFSLSKYSTALGRAPGSRTDVKRIEKFLDWFRRHRGEVEEACFDLYGPEIRDQSFRQIFFGPPEEGK